ncbi:hypothetical protein GDO86_007108, partial [Hymenochirus boettgeri]
MEYVWGLLLLGTMFSYVSRTHESPLLEDTSPMDNLDVLERAKGILIRSIIETMEDDDQNDREPASVEMFSKRQHPGKRSQDELEKRQHPGKREMEDFNLELPKRQHPGRRFMEEIEKRRQPAKVEGEWGKRYSIDSSSYMDFLSDVSKRQHPGKRIPDLSFIKRQHPGKRDQGDTEYENSLDIEKRQHPGKREDPCSGPIAYNCNLRNLPDSMED